MKKCQYYSVKLSYKICDIVIFYFENTRSAQFSLKDGFWQIVLWKKLWKYLNYLVHPYLWEQEYKVDLK